MGFEHRHEVVGTLSELVHHHPQGGGLDRATAQERGVYTKITQKYRAWRGLHKHDTYMDTAKCSMTQKLRNKVSTQIIS